VDHGRVTLALTLLGLLVGIAGIVLLAVPAVPALALILAGVALVAWADDFTRIGGISLGVALVLAVVGSFADNVATLIGARKAGASGWGVAGAGIGMLAGLPFGLIGIVVGPAVGAFVLEYVRNPQLKSAGMAGLGGFAGFLLGIVAKSVFGFLIVGLAVLAYFF
jgi:uncharacterized protein YqgC (DUF456 family)